MHYVADLASQRLDIIVFNVFPIDQNRTALGVIETKKQVRDRALAAA